MIKLVTMPPSHWFRRLPRAVLVVLIPLSTCAPSTAAEELREEASSEVTLAVQATQAGEDGGAPSLDVAVKMVTGQPPQTAFEQETPFELRLQSNSVVTLAAPEQLQHGDEILTFLGWAANGHLVETQDTTAFLTLSEDIQAVAYYARIARVLDPGFGPLTVTATGTAKPLCLPGLSHELTVSWATRGGQRPASVRIAITNPNGELDTFNVKPLSGTSLFPLSFSDGSPAKITVISTDWTDAHASAQVSVQLNACCIVRDDASCQ